MAVGLVVLALLELSAATHATDVGTCPETFTCTGSCSNSLLSPRSLASTLLNSGLGINALGNYVGCQQSGQQLCVVDGLVQNAIAVTQGFCLPETCIESELQSKLAMLRACPDALEKTVEACKSHFCEKGNPTCGKALDAFKLTWQGINPMQVHCGDHAVPFGISASSMVMLGVIACLTLAVCSQCMLECCVAWRRQSSRAGSRSPSVHIPLAELGPVASPDQDAVDIPPANFWKRCLAAFSIKDNLWELSQPSAQRSLSCLDALRTLSMFWIILGHVTLFQGAPLVGLANAAVEGEIIHEYSGQLILNAHFAVDTFFVLSGLLTAYVWIRKARRGLKMPSVPLMVLLRWLRLTPLVAFVVGFYGSLMQFLGSGPLWYRFVAELANCTHWLPNIFYINNFVPTDFHKQCVPWAWYLALDMQFFVVGASVLGLYTARTRMASMLKGISVATMGLLFIAGIVSAWVVATTNSLNLVSGDKLQDMMYEKPWTRCSAYVAGLLAACLITEDRWTTKLQTMQRLVAGLLWFTVFFIFAAILYVSHDFNYIASSPNWNVQTSAAYLALSRPIWAVAIVLLVLLCFGGHGGIIGEILSHRLWEPLGKLTFAAYLIHPALIRFFYYQRVQLFYFTWVELFLAYAAILPLSFVLAAVLYVTIEAPFATLTTPLKR